MTQATEGVKRSCFIHCGGGFHAPGCPNSTQATEKPRYTPGAMRASLVLDEQFVAGEGLPSDYLSKRTRIVVMATVIDRETCAAELAVALRELPLEQFDKDMSECDAADFVDNASAFFQGDELGVGRAEESRFVMEHMYYVEVYYRGYSPSKDAAIRKAMYPVRDAGSGYLIPANRRDIQFRARNKVTLEFGVIRAKTIPGVRCTRIMVESD